MKNKSFSVTFQLLKPIDAVFISTKSCQRSLCLLRFAICSAIFQPYLCPAYMPIGIKTALLIFLLSRDTALSTEYLAFNLVPMLYVCIFPQVIQGDQYYPETELPTDQDTPMLELTDNNVSTSGADISNRETDSRSPSGTSMSSLVSCESHGSYTAMS